MLAPPSLLVFSGPARSDACATTAIGVVTTGSADFCAPFRSALIFFNIVAISATNSLRNGQVGDWRCSWRNTLPGSDLLRAQLHQLHLDSLHTSAIFYHFLNKSSNHERLMRWGGGERGQYHDILQELVVWLFVLPLLISIHQPRFHLIFNRGSPLLREAVGVRHGSAILVDVVLHFAWELVSIGDGAQRTRIEVVMAHGY